MEETKKVEIPAKFKDLVATVEKMSVLDLHELVKVLEAHFGVSAAAVSAGPAAPEPGAAVPAARKAVPGPTELCTTTAQ